MFPYNYVEKISEDGHLAPTVLRDFCAFARVLFDYEAGDEEELTFKVGQFIEVTRDAIHLFTLAHTSTNVCCRLRRKTKVVGGVAKSMEKRCAPVHAFVLFSRLF